MFEVCVKPFNRLSIKTFAVFLSLTTALTPVYAAPVGGQVTQGQGVISQSGNTTSVLQHTDKLVVEWQSFDTINGETVTFLQPNSDAWALNRILSGQATRIDGSLFAKGNVIITNGAGIHFGPNSFVDVGGLIASTSGITDQNFLKNQFIFDQKGDADAMVTNAGTITVQDSGLAALVAPGVENSGYIQADLGTIILGAGEAYTLDFFGDGLIKFAITDPTTKTPKRADGAEADALVTNSGTVKADGGTVIMTASQASNVLSSAINMSGVAQANSVSTRGGKIILGGGGGRVRVSGKVRASAKVDVAGPAYIPVRGGDIHINGKDIEITETAQIDASGLNGGGEVLIGGAFQGGALSSDGEIGYQLAVDTTTIFVGEGAAELGAGFIPEADHVVVDKGATIDVSAIEAGNAGTAVVWSEESTSFAGSIDAKGGALSGDGGLVEVSGKALAFSGTANTTAVNGAMGWLLLDPLGINVVDGPNQAITSAVDPILEITDGALNTMLGFSNVLLATMPSQAEISAGHLGSPIGGGANDDRIVIGDGTRILPEGAGECEGPCVEGKLFLSTSTLELYSEIEAEVFSGFASADFPSATAVSQKPTTVNVFDGALTKGSITQALELVADAGTIGVGAGTFDKFTVAREGITITGQGRTSIVEAGSPAITVAANNVTVQNLLLTGTNSVDEIGVLLDGSAAPNLTGINIVNVDFQDLDEGVKSQGDIGDGNSATVDVSIRGNSVVDKAQFEGFLDDAIDLEDSDGDAVYEIKNISIEDSKDGIELGALKAVTIQGADILDVREEGISFTNELIDAQVLIGGDLAEQANLIVGDRHGIAVDEISGGTFAVRGNLGIAGGNEGLHFYEYIRNAEVDISANFGVGGFGYGILFDGLLDNSNINIKENIGIIGGDDGIYFGGILQNSRVDVSENFGIVGGDDGINIEAILGGSFSVSGNNVINGIDGSGIEFDGVIYNNAQITVALNDEISGFEEGIEFDAEVSGSTVNIKGNERVTGEISDGIHFDYTITDSNITIADNLNIEGGGSGIAFFGTDRRGPKTPNALAGNTKVLIDRNGAQEQNGNAYDGSSAVELADMARVGNIHGVEGSGILFYDAIVDNASVTISRNVIAENYNGIEFGEISSTAAQHIHNNFVGLSSLAGIAFFGDVVSAVEIFQNYIISNDEDGIGVYEPFSSGGPSVGGPNIGAGKIKVHQNYLPGSLDPFGNGNFAINNEGVGDMEANGNWWGTSKETEVAAALNGVSVPTEFLNTGVDTNVEKSLGATDFDPFAFQSGEEVVVAPVINLPGILPLIPVRVTNIQAPADHFLRPVDILTILPEGIFSQDYRLGTCEATGSESDRALRLQCNLIQKSGDVAFVVSFLGQPASLDLASLN